MTKIVSWNTNGLRATAKNGFFAPLFKNKKMDILCLQETKAEADQLPLEVRDVPGYSSYFSHSKLRKGYSGVAIYSKIKPIEIFYGIGIERFDIEGRIVGTKYEDFTLINVYFPNAGTDPERLKYKLEFYDEFLKFVLKLRKKGEHVIFCGDVNTAHTAIDLARPKANEENTGFLPIEREWIDEVINNGFSDVFRHFYPTKKDAYTYWDMKTFARDRNVGWRIDYFFASNEIVSKIKKTGIDTDYMGSDHCPIWMEIE
ncbi:MAG: exodeoxyribonuclease III [Minisyncoccia bacterium]